MKKQRSPGLIAIVVYKAFLASLLAVTSLALLLALKNYQNLELFAKSYLLEGQQKIIEWILEKILQLQPRTLKYSGILAGSYALITAVEAIGLWDERAWATILVIGLVGISIPPEIFELIQRITLLKLGVFVVNVAVLWYLLRRFRSSE